VNTAQGRILHPPAQRCTVSFGGSSSHSWCGAPGGTLEEKIVAPLHKKQDLVDSLLEGTDVSGRLSEAELLQLLTSPTLPAAPDEPSFDV